VGPGARLVTASPNWGTHFSPFQELTLAPRGRDDSFTMAATDATVLGEAKDQTESTASVGLTLGVLALFVAWMVQGADRWVGVWLASWPELLFWIAIVLVIDFFPIKVGPLSLTLDVPVLLAVALLYTPELAASVACLAALDIREFRGRVRIGRAIFNRAQIALSVLAAGHVLHAFGPDVMKIQSLILPTLAALLADYAVNATLVTVVRVVDGSARNSFLRELWRLKVGSWWEFSATYLAYGLLAILFARLYVDAGEWPVAILLVSALVARQSLMRSRQLERLGEDLATHQQLLMRALDRVVEERRDERLLVGGQLHDDVLQSIIRVRMGLNTILKNEFNEMVTAELVDIDRATQAAHEGLREVIRGLRGSPLGPRGLLAALDSLTRELRRDWRASIVVDLPQEVGLPAVYQVALYQAARESILNALKHANASEIRLRLTERAGEATLEVSDNGIGFASSELIEQGPHFGMALLRERIAALDGSVTIESAKGRGTKILVRLPL